MPKGEKNIETTTEPVLDEYYFPATETRDAVVIKAASLAEAQEKYKSLSTK